MTSRIPKLFLCDEVFVWDGITYMAVQLERGDKLNETDINLRYHLKDFSPPETLQNAFLSRVSSLFTRVFQR